jgi:hypothetical protein
MKLLVVLTQYKRSNLEMQLIQVKKQTIQPDYLVVFQNENHININNLKEKYNFIHIKSDYNTKFFGRFSICFNFPVDICMILDDDIIPGINCFKNYMTQCINLNSIIGGNGRIGTNNENIRNLKQLPDTGIRNTNNLVDFVGHLWCFRKAWLYYMFSIEPYTYDTGEDMHLCFTSKLLGNISSYIAEQKNYDDMSDITNNKLGCDQYASCKTTNPQLRINIEKYFIEKYNFQFIKEN